MPDWDLGHCRSSVVEATGEVYDLAGAFRLGEGAVADHEDGGSLEGSGGMFLMPEH